MNYRLLLLMSFITSLFGCQRQTQADISQLSYDDYPVYTGTDLGLTYTPGRSVFKIWSPPAAAARLLLYEAGEGGEPIKEVEMTKDDSGLWTAIVGGNQLGKYYTFQVQINGKWLAETPDPYVRAVGVNGLRGQVIKLEDTNPVGWESDRRPPQADFNSIVIYELHVRDLSSHPAAGIQHRGKYLGLTETGTKTPGGAATGLDHLRELGVTHVHLLPVFDFRSLDESKPDSAQYNWGYDPQHYNVPEGSYATDPYDGAVRIREFKQMVQALHQAGIRVIMDVVYNHTGATQESVFNQLVPGYYYRQNAEGGFSDASACGNETASERPMMRKFMLESMKYWVEEYHIDGFRIDLMGIHDIATINEISAALHAIDPTIFIYGEGWTAGASPLPDSLRALKANTYRLDKVAAFSDDLRDGLKGSVFEHEDTGFVSGKTGTEESIKFGVVAATQHPQVDYSLVNYSKAPWSGEPYQCIAYVDCHDNHTLWDRLAISRADASETDRIRMDLLATTIVLTSQGVAFLHAGSELLRTKQGVENSYKSPDSINRIDWTRKERYRPVFDFYRQLIALRKAHPAFRMTSTAAIQQHLQFLPTTTPLLVAYQLDGAAVGDSWSDIIVLYNGAPTAQSQTIPAGSWKVVLSGDKIEAAGLSNVNSATVTVPPISAMIIVGDGGR